jgi:hypothetical protein
VGRHSTESQRNAHRRAATLKLAGATIVVCLIAVALYAALGSHGGPGSPAAKAAPPAALTIEVTATHCPVFVRRPGGEVLINQTLTDGQSVHFNGPPFDVVVCDAGAVKIYVNGRPRSVGPPGRQVTVTIP